MDIFGSLSGAFNSFTSSVQSFLSGGSSSTSRSGAGGRTGSSYAPSYDSSNHYAYNRQSHLSSSPAPSSQPQTIRKVTSQAQRVTQQRQNQDFLQSSIRTASGALATAAKTTADMFNPTRGIQMVQQGLTESAKAVSQMRKEPTINAMMTSANRVFNDVSRASVSPQTYLPSSVQQQIRTGIDQTAQAAARNLKNIDPNKLAYDALKVLPGTPQHSISQMEKGIKGAQDLYSAIPADIRKPVDDWLGGGDIGRQQREIQAQSRRVEQVGQEYLQKGYLTKSGDEYQWSENAPESAQRNLESEINKLDSLQGGYNKQMESEFGHFKEMSPSELDLPFVGKVSTESAYKWGQEQTEGYEGWLQEQGLRGGEGGAAGSVTESLKQGVLDIPAWLLGTTMIPMGAEMVVRDVAHNPSAATGRFMRMMGYGTGTQAAQAAEDPMRFATAFAGTALVSKGAKKAAIDPAKAASPIKIKTSVFETGETMKVERDVVIEGADPIPPTAFRKLMFGETERLPTERRTVEVPETITHTGVYLESPVTGLKKATGRMNPWEKQRLVGGKVSLPEESPRAFDLGRGIHGPQGSLPLGISEGTRPRLIRNGPWDYLDIESEAQLQHLNSFHPKEVYHIGKLSEENMKVIGREVLHPGFIPDTPNLALGVPLMETALKYEGGPSALSTFRWQQEVMGHVRRSSRPTAVRNPYEVGREIKAIPEEALADILDYMKETDPNHVIGGSYAEATQSRFYSEPKDIDAYSEYHREIGEYAYQRLVKEVGKDHVKLENVADDYTRVKVRKPGGNWLTALDIHTPEKTGKPGDLIGRYGFEVQEPIVIEGLNFKAIGELKARKVSNIGGLREGKDGWYTGPEEWRGKDYGDTFVEMQADLINAEIDPLRVLHPLRATEIEGLFTEGQEALGGPSPLPKEMKTAAQTRYQSATPFLGRTEYLRVPGTNKYAPVPDLMKLLFPTGEGKSIRNLEFAPERSLSPHDPMPLHPFEVDVLKTLGPKSMESLGMFTGRGAHVDAITVKATPESVRMDNAPKWFDTQMERSSEIRNRKVPARGIRTSHSHPSSLFRVGETGDWILEEGHPFSDADLFGMINTNELEGRVMIPYRGDGRILSLRREPGIPWDENLAEKYYDRADTLMRQELRRAESERNVRGGLAEFENNAEYAQTASTAFLQSGYKALQQLSKEQGFHFDVFEVTDLRSRNPKVRKLSPQEALPEAQLVHRPLYSHLVDTPKKAVEGLVDRIRYRNLVDMAEIPEGMAFEKSRASSRTGLTPAEISERVFGRTEPAYPSARPREAAALSPTDINAVVFGGDLYPSARATKPAPTTTYPAVAPGTGRSRATGKSAGTPSPRTKKPASRDTRTPTYPETTLPEPTLGYPAARILWGETPTPERTYPRTTTPEPEKPTRDYPPTTPTYPPVTPPPIIPPTTPPSTPPPEEPPNYPPPIKIPEIPPPETPWEIIYPPTRQTEETKRRRKKEKKEERHIKKRRADQFHVYSETGAGANLAMAAQIVFGR